MILWFDKVLKQWDSSVVWIDAWAMVGEVRETLERCIGLENEDWCFVDKSGLRTVRLPAGISFKNEIDATIFVLNYG